MMHGGVKDGSFLILYQFCLKGVCGIEVMIDGFFWGVCDKESLVGMMWYALRGSVFCLVMWR